jgi:hypothetical protein
MAGTFCGHSFQRGGEKGLKRGHGTFIDSAKGARERNLRKNPQNRLAKKKT